MTEVKEQFKEAASKQTTTLGWKFIFDKYDDDGSGELDIEEFRQCVRHECKLTPSPGLTKVPRTNRF